MNKSTKIDFELKEKHGINSFKVVNYSRKLKSLIHKLNKECIQRLNSGIQTGYSNSGITATIESPKCCIDYAEFNIDRSVPVRQYFGKTIQEDNNTVTRWSYGVGSGNKTVGGDTLTTKTRKLTPIMEDMCKELSKNDIFKCKGNYCIDEDDTPVSFNHVTVLYYLMDSRSNNRIVLRPHCDLEVSVTNDIKANNSQRNGSPTIVLSLQSSKNICFYKRYADGKKFTIINESDRVDSMQLCHGDFFVLHPDDERVIPRMIQTHANRNKYTKEARRSQFQHGVAMSINRNENERSGKGYKMGISVCFRESVVQREYCRNLDIMLDSNMKWLENDKESLAMKNRNDKMARKRNELENTQNIIRMNKKLRQYYNYAVIRK